MTDLLTIALPFVFMFAVAYGALDVAKVMKSRRVNGMIALVIAFFAISSDQVTGFIFTVMPFAAILFIVVFFLGFIKTLFGGAGEKDYTLIIMIAALLIIFMMGQGYDWLKDLVPGISMSSSNFMYLGGLILVIVIFYAAYKYKGSPGAPAK